MNSGQDKPPVPGRDVADATHDPLLQSGPQAVPPVGTLRGAHTYRLLRKLGEGGQGSVYEAEDLDNYKRVAVKLLRSTHDGALARFKREFRTRERVRHRSLAEFGELACCDGTWFFTMSLVQGVPLLRYLVELNETSDAPLRACFAQLAEALTALHAAGLIHRDVKSDNVLVESDGRVVLLDLGLVVDVSPAHTTDLIGTPVYMAPEQWSGARPSVASDWYAFGVLLFEALTRKPPFSGSQLEVFVAKTQQLPPSPGACNPDLARDLVELCEGLLRRDWTERLGSREVLHCFASSHPVRIGVIEPEPEVVGRDAELKELEATLAQARSGALVFLEGVSGIGKTALLRAFGERIAQRGAWLLTGRCYEAESVPFKAFDEALDGLARTLERRAKTNLDVYRPRHSQLLARVFPTLALLESKRGTDSIMPVDPAELRATAIHSLVELLQRMADDSPVVICLDDVQWADADSIELLDALAHCDFPLMIIASFQSEESRPAAFQKLVPQRVFRLAVLDPGATRHLAERISDRLATLSEDVFEQLHRQTGGSPFLVCEWARFVDEYGTAPTHALRQLLETRITSLSPHQLRLVALVAISGEPIQLAVAARVADADETSDVMDLRRLRLIRTLSKDGDAYVDIYHNSIREVAASALSEAERRELHGLVAAEYEQSGAPPERRVAHLIAAGEREAAATLALESARAAEQSFAFVRAAELYDLSRGLLDPTSDPSITITVEQAKAWQNALRPLRAGEALLDASQHCREPERASELLRLAGEQLLLGGDVVRGLAAIEEALRDQGLSLADSIATAVAEAFALYAKLETRGLQPAEAAEPDRRRANRIALCLSIARCLHHVDLRGIPFALLGLLEALESGDASLLQQALAGFVMVTASHLPNPLVEPALQRCRELTQKSADPFAHALCQMAIAEVEHFAGRYAAAERACDRAERTLLTACVGVSRELGQIRSMALVILHSNKGDFSSHMKRALEWLEDADRRSDVFNGNWLRAACSLAWMAQDVPARAREELARAEQAWPAALGGTFEAACALYLDVLDRYEDVPNVHERAAQGRASVLGSPVIQTPLLQGYLHVQRGWGCLRELGARPAALAKEQRLQLRAAARLAIDALRQLGLPGWLATADAFEVNLRLLDGPYDDELDALLERAHATFYDAQLLSSAACVRRRRGELAKGELGSRWLAEADLELERLGVNAPAKFARAYFSPF